MQIDYKNYAFDYTDRIAGELAQLKTVPDAAATKISASDAIEATGVVLTGAYDTANTTDYYLNTYVAGDAITLTAADGAKTACATSSASSSDIAVVKRWLNSHIHPRPH